MAETPTPQTYQSPNTINIKLTYDFDGNLVVILPPTITTKGGKTTLLTGNVENELRNILEIELKIKQSETSRQPNFQPKQPLKTLDLKI